MPHTMQLFRFAKALSDAERPKIKAETDAPPRGGRKRKKANTIVVVFLACLFRIPVIVLGFSLLQCEIRTLRHGAELAELYRQNTMITDIDYCKVLAYDDTRARVYYVEKNGSGDVLTFEKENGEWVEAYWETMWGVQGGNADNVVWPYIFDYVFHSAPCFCKVFLLIGAYSCFEIFP